MQAGWLVDLLQWFRTQFLWLVHAIWELLSHLVLTLLQNTCDIFVLAINAIPVPDFLAQYSMSGLLGQGGPVVAWLVGDLGIGIGLGMIAAGYAFRLLRKLFTLGQW